MRRRWLAVLAAAVCGCVAACTYTGEENPALSTDDRGLYDLRRKMESSPVTLERPVVVVSGYGDPGIASRGIEKALAQLTSGNRDDFIVYNPGSPTSFDAAAIELGELLCRELSEDAGCVETPEVDVVALSMGAIVARHAARPTVRWPRLKIRRLYTIAGPHTGAEIASRFAAVSPAVADMSPGSAFLEDLNRADVHRRYEIIPYGIRGDGIVGLEHSAPPGMEPLWVRGRTFGSHLGVNMNDTILTDIARRLRGEASLFTGDPASKRVVMDAQ